MADEAAVHEKSQDVSGVAPLLFSASTETHDVAIAAGTRAPVQRSPFAAEALERASGE
ncbi:hypothetical protein [Amycolatopsis sp. H20-H5]|uniref:hypothetical protein n=1 Tax=Amycolatopsis sp. H20-H5 TaxID=3046309 RepID=UPI002DBFC6D5|nr:hypothetical protein [Amycolatopsis sp. H20-H5]MEC3975458.1 hypothetical protein [Amycolatopsis sp. H20-H5]